MENYQKIELYKRRQFSEKLNAAFSFLRQNAGPFIKAQLAISGPVALLVAFLYTMLIQSMLGAVNTGSADYAFSNQFITTIWFTAIIYILLAVSILLVTFSYVKLYQEQDGRRPGVADVLKVVLRNLGYAILAIIMIYIIVLVSAFLLFFPAIYFGVICTLVLPIMVLEGVSPITALQRAFYLIGGKWWSTFGLLAVTVILAYIIMLALVLPVSYTSVAVSFFSIEAPQTMVADETYFWMLGLTSLLYYIGGILGISVVQLSLVFQYGNLIEMKEARGLMREIEELGNEEPPAANEGEY